MLGLHDIRFVEDDWESPTLGAWGLGWEVWVDGMEVSQFTYFQQVGGIECDPVSTELTYGLERLAMYVQGVESMFDLDYNGASGPVASPTAKSSSGPSGNSRPTISSSPTLPVSSRISPMPRPSAGHWSHRRLALPAYDQCLKASHLFNLLDARGASA